jgi:endonuclease/exonuclease/phosphatase family metal-dependent hydrolase
MRISTIIFILIAFVASLSLAQNADRILIDGNFEDWSNNSDLVQTYEDEIGDASVVDIEYLELANDDDYLFMHLKLSAEIDLVDDFNPSSRLDLFIDSDNNSNTGYSINGIGAEYLLDFYDRRVISYDEFGFSTTLSFYDIGYAHLPTVTSDEFEFLIERFYNNTQVIGEEIKLYLRETVYDDETDVMSYTLNIQMPDFEKVSMAKPSVEHFRLFTFNTLQDGLLDNNQRDQILRLINAADPDIIHLNEVYDTNPGFVKNLLENFIGGTWYVHKYNGENMVASRFPFLSIYEIYYGRLGAALIDLPDSQYDKDLLAVNGHLSCCGNDDGRQEQVDALIQFLADAKQPGGLLELEEGTPMLFSGDMNFVGNDDQVNTVIDGNIDNNNLYGPDTKPDWGDGNFADYRPIQVASPKAITWNTRYPDPGDYPVGRLDYVFYGPSALQPRGGFVLDTRDLSDEELSEYGLLQSDAFFASDHLALVTDFSVIGATSTKNTITEEVRLYPNPAKGKVYVQGSNDWTTYSIKDVLGRTVKSGNLQSNEISLSGLKSGIYMVEFIGDESRGKSKLIIE